MGGRWDKMARGIKAFAENPLVNLVKGVFLLVIGLSEVSRTLRDDLANHHLSVGHGIIIIGLFSILNAIPSFIDSVEAWARYFDLREKAAGAREDRDS